MNKQFNLILLILIQLIFNTALVSDQISTTLFNYTILGPGIGLPVNLLFTGISLYLISQSVDLTRKEQKLKQLEKQNSYNEDLSTAMRTIKHDVANQIMIIDGLYQLGKRTESIKYSRKMLSKFDWMDKVLQLKNPEVVSLLIKKINEAHDHGIEISVDLISEEDIEQEIALDKLTRIISNLLDNAIYALKTKPFDKRQLTLKIAPDLSYFEVENSGVIEEEVQKKIFEKGFTTKGQEGSGLGLYIVKTLAEELNGKVDCYCENEKTKFTVEFQKIS